MKTEPDGNLKVIPAFCGFPTNTLFLAISLAIASYFLIGPYTLIYVFFALTLIYGHCFFIRLDGHYEKLSCDLGGFFPHYLYIKGLPDNFFSDIEVIIETNQLVGIHCPKNKLLRIGLRQHVYGHGGFSEFFDGEDVTLSGLPLGNRTLLLSYRTKEKLQCAISTMQNRGWKMHGEQGVEANLIDRHYTQTMMYEPRYTESRIAH
ncbi:hypothetical protein OH460_08510 [Vibrio sp. Makdt]|uniref:hypothetical protein n=1 Tax=Vibrio sp. Makdt TaxID=2998828 RepID=UPI0022CD7FDB|nr:hypothetical protein [Vibrio sp. Makdt]MDA0152342.1 hypothetical protein [Vibrio sp. Makdt]